MKLKKVKICINIAHTIRIKNNNSIQQGPISIGILSRQHGMNVICPLITVALIVVEVGVVILTITPQLQIALAFLLQVILRKHLAALLPMVVPVAVEAVLVAVEVVPVAVEAAPVAVEAAPAVVEVAVAEVKAVIKNDHHLYFSNSFYKCMIHRSK